MTTEDKFDYINSYGDKYKDCHFDAGKYPNGMLYLGISNESIGPVTECTTSEVGSTHTSPDVGDNTIAIKKYGYINEKMDEFLIKMGIIEEEPVAYETLWINGDTHAGASEYIDIPFYNLTNSGKNLFKDLKSD